MPIQLKLHQSSFKTLFVLIFLSVCGVSQAQFSLTETFANNSIPSNLIIGNNAQLTAASGIDPAGQGWLRLTDNLGESGYCYINQNIPSGLGVLAEFEFKAWSTSMDPNADGFSMFLFDANYGPGTFSIGNLGGALGYINLPGAYIGIGLDEFGNNSNPLVGGDALAPGFTSQAITVRAPTSQGNVYLAGTGLYLGGTPLQGTLLSYGASAFGRPPDYVYYRKVRITIAPVAGSMYQIIVALQTSPSGTMTNVLTTTTATPPPANLKIGFAASTGSYWANHEIRNLTVTTPGGVRAEKTGPQLFKNGDDVSYKIKVYNDGLTTQSGITVTDSLPAGFQFGSVAFDNAGNVGNTFDISAGAVSNNVYTNNSLGLDVGSYGIVTINGKMALTDSATKQMKNTGIAKAAAGVIDPDLINDTSRFISYRVPVVNKKDATICSSNSTGLTLVTMAGAQLNWTVSTSGSITGATASSGIADASGNFTLNQTVTNTGTTPGTVTYTITPSYIHSLPGGSTITATGDPVICTVTVNPRPIANDITIADAAVCSGKSATLVASSTTISNPVFKWYTDAALTQLTFTGSTFTTPALTQAISYYVTVENGSACPNLTTNAKKVNVTINANPAAPVLPASVYVCDGSPLTLSTTALIGYSYNWTWGTGGTASGATANITSQATQADAVSYLLTATETATGCIATNTVDVLLKPLPAVPSITWTAVCEGSDQLLAAASTTAGATYNWTGPTPLTINSDKATIKAATIAANGVYSVSATLNGCTSNAATTNVQIKPMPAVPTLSWTAVCEGSDQLLKAVSTTPGTSYKWSGAKLLIINDQAIIQAATVASNGVYGVAATLNGCMSAQATGNVQIKPMPVAPTASYNTGVCQNSNLLLSASTTTVGTIGYNWTGPNSYTSNLAAPSIAKAGLSAAGHYLVSATLNGCTSASTDLNVAINAAPAPPAITGSLEACVGGTPIQLANHLTNIQNVTWFTQSGTLIGAVAPTVPTDKAGNVVYLAANNSAQHCQSDLVTLTASVKTNVSVAVNEKDVTCKGGTNGSIELTVTTGLAPYVYKWSNGTNQKNAVNLPAGKYNALITDANGCNVNTADIVVKDGVAPQPPVANNFEVCEETGSATLTANGTNLQWYSSDGSSLSAAPRIDKSTPKFYSYYVSSKDALGCEGAKTIITALIKPRPQITAINKKEPNCNGYVKGTFNVSATGGCNSGAYTFTLLNTMFTQSTGNFKNIEPGTYAVQVSDACGCSVTQSVDMNVKMIDCDLQLPNAFTPNNDNRNDIFRPTAWGNISDYRLQVFNRQGQLVFQSTTPANGWDGTIKGMEQPQGTYIWQLVYKNEKGELRNLKGTVVLVK